MPIEVHADVSRPSPEEFGALAYDVMACAMQIHNEIGRFFDEKIYKRLIARRFGGVELEVPVIVRHDGFEKCYALDMLVRGAALFEWKAVESLGTRHRAQMLHYLWLCDLPKGKLANVRSELIEHEFVNTTLRPPDRHTFEIDDKQFVALDNADRDWKAFLLAALHDWGAGLDVHLYESAISHCFGGDSLTLKEIDIIVSGHKVGVQKARLTPSNAAFKVTTLTAGEVEFERHAKRFVNHTSLAAIHWINITRQRVRFKSMLRNVA
jgi:GxxExxY protein